MRTAIRLPVLVWLLGVVLHTPVALSQGSTPIPHARIVHGQGSIATTWLAEGTRRYGHGVLGDDIEAAALVNLGSHLAKEDLEASIAMRYEAYDIYKERLQADGDRISLHRAFYTVMAAISIHEFDRGEFDKAAGLATEAYDGLTDLGMTGPAYSVLGRRVDRVLKRFTTGLPTPFDVSTGPAQINGALIDIDQKTGRARSIKRVFIK